MAKIGFIGLGWMGIGMCSMLIRGGHELTVWDLKEEAVQRGMQAGAARSASSPKEVAQYSDIVSVMVPDDNAVRSVMEGENGLLKNLMPGSVLMIHSTISVDTVRDLAAKAQEKGIYFVDAPISGDIKDMGNATMITGCQEEIWDTIRPILKCFGHPVRVGGIGCGAVAKLVNNTALICTMFGTSYSLRMGEKAGCDVDKLLEVMTQPSTTSNSWFVQNYVYQCPGMSLFAKGEGQMKLLPKDLKLGLKLAEEVGMEHPVAEACVGLSFADCVCDKYKELEQSAGFKLNKK